MWYPIVFALSDRMRNLPYDKSGETMVCAGGQDKDACQVSEIKFYHILFQIWLIKNKILK